MMQQNLKGSSGDKGVVLRNRDPDIDDGRKWQNMRAELFLQVKVGVLGAELLVLLRSNSLQMSFFDRNKLEHSGVGLYTKNHSKRERCSANGREVQSFLIE